MEQQNRTLNEELELLKLQSVELPKNHTAELSELLARHKKEIQALTTNHLFEKKQSIVRIKDVETAMKTMNQDVR